MTIIFGRPLADPATGEPNAAPPAESANDPTPKALRKSRLFNLFIVDSFIVARWFVVCIPGSQNAGPEPSLHRAHGRKKKLLVAKRRFDDYTHPQCKFNRAKGIV